MQKYRKMPKKVEPFLCQYCNTRFATKEELNQHKITFHAEAKLHSCNHCGKNFKRKSSLKYHQESAHNITNKPKVIHECSFCPRMYANFRDLKLHVELNHRVALTPNSMFKLQQSGFQNSLQDYSANVLTLNLQCMEELTHHELLLSEMKKVIDFQNTMSNFFYKLQIVIKACYVKKDESDSVTHSVTAVLPSDFASINPSNFRFREHIILSKIKQCINNHYNFEATGSGWRLESILQVQMRIVETNTISSQHIGPGH